VYTFGGDANGYWQGTDYFGFRGDASVFVFHKPGTAFMFLLAYPLSQVLNLSFLTVSLIFSLLGFLGFVFFLLTILQAGTIKRLQVYGIKIFPLILFLPNMHFWSGGLGKDTVMFFALNLFIFSLTKPSRYIIGIAISFYLAYMIRPHIALLMVVGLGFALLTSTGIGFIWRILLLALSIYVFVLIAPSVFDFIGVEEDSLGTIADVSQIRSKTLARATVGSAIDISNYNVAQKILTFFYRPLFVDAGSAFGLFISVENLFYLILTLASFRLNFFQEFLRMPAYLKASVFILFSSAFFLSSSMGNLGIIIRQKNMVMFMLLLIVVYIQVRVRRNTTLKRVTSPSLNPRIKTFN
jgi:hypothetical protein